MSSSHQSPSKPSTIAALVALTIVVRFHPSWASRPVAERASELGVSAERISRLANRALRPFDELVGRLTRRGRPPTDAAQNASHVELELTRALLEVTTSVLARCAVEVRGARELIMGAWLRLSKIPGMTQRRFCEALSMSPRTLRDWLKRQRKPSPEPTDHPPQSEPRRRAGRKRRGPRRKRFGFDVVLPQTQMASDTTDIEVLGVGLKLMASQDIGGRDVSLLDGVLIDEHESADNIASLFAKTLQGLAGAQMCTDQGTPYMAQATTHTLEQLGVEHAPQKEGDPMGKATIERAFRTIKDVAAQLFEVTNRLAHHMPALRSPGLAIPLARTIVSSLLRAYQHGARAAREAIEARGGIEPEALAQAAQQSRQRAQATERSARLLLAEIHQHYGIERPLKRFVDGLRLYPVSVLHEAERQFRTQVHRDDIRDRASYYAALVRRCHEQHKQATQARQRERAEARERLREHRRYEAQMYRWQSHPEELLRAGLEVIVNQWNHGDNALLFNGVGPGLGMMAHALRRMVELYGNSTTVDMAVGIANDFRLASVGAALEACVEAVCALLDRQVLEVTGGIRNNHAGPRGALCELSNMGVRVPIFDCNTSAATSN
jgi:hypothetical protein